MSVSDHADRARLAIAERNPSKALDHLQAAIALEPNSAKLISQSGVCLMMLGQKTEAIEAFEQAHGLDPNSHSIANNLTRAYVGAMRLNEAAALVHRGSGDPPTIQELARALWRDGQKITAIEILRAGENRFADDHDLRHLRGAFASTMAPMWHIPMTAHAARNAAYRQAIEMTVNSGDLVLDIGTGSGLLAMMAARAGCKHVFACEANPLLAQLAREIVARNGFESAITIIEKHSSDLVIGTDLPDKADVLVTEIFDNALVGEGALPSIMDARARLLKPDARMIPQSATLKGALVGSPGFASYHSISEVDGFDLSPLTLLSHPLSYKDVHGDFDAGPYNSRLSDPIDIVTWNFAEEFEPSFATQCQIEARLSGTANAMLLWFELQLAEGVSFASDHPAPFDHWREVMQPLDHAVTVEAGGQVQLDMAYDRYFRFAASSKVG